MDAAWYTKEDSKRAAPGAEYRAGRRILMMEKNKMLWYVVGAVAILVVLSVVFRGTGGWQGSYLSPTPSPSPTPSSSAYGTPSPKPAAMPSTYGDAVKQYGDRRIQFDMYCQAKPVNNTYKNGSYLMLDNRSGDARIITVHGVQYHLAGYGWTIILLSSKVLPATWPVDCGAARNVSNILIQK
jgi:hypothetical protein